MKLTAEQIARIRNTARTTSTASMLTAAAEANEVKELDLSKFSALADAVLASASPPRVYVGTYGKYAGGSIAGGWLNLDDYADKDAFYEACKELHKDEADPEFMFQDYEGFPERYYGESSLNDKLWDWLKLDEDDRELLEVYIDETGNADATIEQAQEAFAGKFESESDWAYQYWEDTGGPSTDDVEHYATVSDTDARLIAQEDADMRVEDMSEDEILEEAEKTDEHEAAESEADKEKILEQAKEALREKYSSEEEAEIKKDPVGYFVDQQGIYSLEEFAKAPFVSIDYEKFVRDAQMNGDVSFAKKDGEVWVFHAI